MRSLGIVGLVAGIGVCAPASAAFVIRDASFFDGKPHTFVDFETKGDGSPVSLGFLEAELQSWNEYESLGFVYDTRPVGWQNTPPPAFGGPIIPEGHFGDAIDAIGSWPTAVGGTASEGWSIHFLGPVHSFGIGVVRNGFHMDDPSLLPTIEAYDQNGDLIGVLELSGDMVQGNFGGLWAGGAFGELYNVEYGFMGLASSTPIARLEFINSAIYDDLHFSAVPAPGAGAVLVMGGALALRRRR